MSKLFGYFFEVVRKRRFKESKIHGHSTRSKPRKALEAIRRQGLIDDFRHME